MTPADVARIEAVRGVVLAAVHATRAALQSLDALLLEPKEADPSAAAWDTFDFDPNEVKK